MNSFYDDNFMDDSYDNTTSQSSLLSSQQNNNKQKLSKLQQVSKKVDKSAQDTARRIVKSQSLEEIQDLTHLFNVAQTKKQVIRTLTYNQLLDSITEQMQERLDKRADQFSNKDLLDYAKVVTDGLDKAQKQIQQIDSSPMIQINQQNNNVIVGDGDELDRESRRKIMLAAAAAMELLQKQGAQPQAMEESEIDSGDIVVDNSVVVEDSNDYDDEDVDIDEESFSLYNEEDE